MERNHEAQLMKKIYFEANLVLIWLGPSSNTSASIMRRAAGKVEHTNKRDLSGELVLLLSSTYWKRLWVIQEGLLAG